MILLKPFLLIDGGIGGVVVLIILDHRGVTVGPDGVFTLGMMLALLFIGYLIHAIID